VFVTPKHGIELPNFASCIDPNESSFHAIKNLHASSSYQIQSNLYSATNLHLAARGESPGKVVSYTLY